MSIGTVVTGGFGTFGTVNFLPTLGFQGAAAAAVEAHGVIVRRGKTRLWPEWQAQLEQEELTLDSAALELDALRQEQEQLKDTLTSLRTRGALLDERIKIQSRIIEIQAAEKATRRKMVAQRQQIKLARARMAREEKDITYIVNIIEDLYG